MKKGFTLVELLAVIVVLAIILVIAIPNVMKIIEKARIDALIKNENMMVSAAKKYLINNSLLTPENIGDTTEIKLDNLKNDKFIGDIKNPKGSNNCNGYVLVTKVNDNECDYNSNLNSENNIYDIYKLKIDSYNN